MELCGYAAAAVPAQLPVDIQALPPKHTLEASEGGDRLMASAARVEQTDTEWTGSAVVLRGPWQRLWLLRERSEGVQEGPKSRRGSVLC